MMVFVDQPLGVGFSYTDSNFQVSDTQTAGMHLNNFIYNFFSAYKHLKGNPVYFCGESYAGHYIPNFAYQLLNEPRLSGVNFAGIMIGDGWIDPITQVQSYGDYMYSVGLLSSSTRQQVHLQQQDAVRDLSQGNPLKAGSDLNLGDYQELVGGVSYFNYEWYSINIPTDFITWLNQPQNKVMLGVPSFLQMQYMNYQLAQNFLLDQMLSFKQELQWLLSQDKYNILLYQGQLDLVVTPKGQDALVHSMLWGYSDNWIFSEQKPWLKNSTALGNYKTFRNFTYVNVYGVGHVFGFENTQGSQFLLQQYLNQDFL